MPKIKEVRAVTPYFPKKIEEKAEVEIKPVKFPKDLGEEHPFSFKLCEMSYCKIGIIKAIVDKYIDYIVSPGFFVKSKDSKAETIINNFILNIGFESILRKWIQEALIKGNGFLELSKNGKEINIQVVNANYMYVNRDKKGNILGYNQYVGEMDKFNPKKIIDFKEPQIAHLLLNTVGDDAYGYGIVYSLLKTVDNLTMSEKDMHLLIDRKANNPLMFKIGSLDNPPTQAEIDEAGAKLETLNNLHEWAIPYYYDPVVVDFGNLSEKFATVLEHDMNMIFYISQVPAVLMGMANVAEGLGTAQSESWERRIASLQAAIEKVIEEKIFGPILEMNGISTANPNSHVEFEWGQPSESKINERISKLTTLMQNPLLSPALRAAIEKDIAEQLGYEELNDVLIEPTDAEDSEVERQKEEELEQPEVPGEKESFKLSESVDIRLNEWLNFDYRQYEEEVLNFIQNDTFDNLKGNNAKDYSLGMLNQRQINKLKGVMYNGFEQNKTIRELSDDIKKLNLKDRYSINAEGKKVLQVTKEDRPIMIARSESTRVASEGVLNHYKKQGVENVTFVASISDRTCNQCLELNGRIFNLNESRGVIPVHAMCRCSWIAITE